MPDPDKDYCLHCRNTGLSVFGTGNMTVSICNACRIGVNLQEILKLFATVVTAEGKTAEQAAKIVADMRRIVEV